MLLAFYNEKYILSNTNNLGYLIDFYFENGDYQTQKFVGREIIKVFMNKFENIWLDIIKTGINNLQNSYSSNQKNSLICFIC